MNYIKMLCMKSNKNWLVFMSSHLSLVKVWLVETNCKMCLHVFLLWVLTFVTIKNHTFKYYSTKYSHLIL